MTPMNNNNNNNNRKYILWNVYCICLVLFPFHPIYHYTKQQVATYGIILLGMRSIPVSEKYRSIKSDSVIYHEFAKYRGIPSGSTGVQYAFIMVLLLHLIRTNF